MNAITLQELQRDPSALLDRVEAGERLIVSRDGRRVAELRPLTSPRSDPRPFGLAAGALTIPDDFDSPLPENVFQDFEGS